jgi:hypothetical protein
MGSSNGKAKVTALSKQPSMQSQTWLVGQLATLAMARQANVDSATLEFFAVSLSVYPPNDLRNAIDRLCHSKRQAGETAFPDLATFEEAIERETNRRMQEADQAELDAENRRRFEHPEDYISLKEIYEVMQSKRNKPELLKPGSRK